MCDRDTDSGHSIILSWLEKISNDLDTVKSRESTPISLTSENTSFKVYDLLKSTVRGQLVLSFHHQKGYIDNKHQKTLTHCITESYIATGRKMNYSDMKQWENAICQIFPKEKPETYFLYRKKRKEESLRQTVFTEKTSHEEFLEKKCWLTHNCTPWDQVKSYWKETSVMRLNSGNSLKKLLEDWPRYSDSNGYELVEIDFENMYPGKSNKLFLKLENFYKKIMPILQSDVKDKASRELLLSKVLNTNISNDSKYLITMLLLHCILQPLRRNRNEKPTIADAQYDFITLVSTSNDIMPSISALIKDYADKKRTLQPGIIAVDTDFSDISKCYFVTASNGNVSHL
ncbi:uncharacterized protein [Eurosta solidaginis]|uniref:uncharacterized protein n=1 Tax=Eurosta solidaginis TaxID=178769 RepID=UPI0035309F7E